MILQILNYSNDKANTKKAEFRVKRTKLTDMKRTDGRARLGERELLDSRGGVLLPPPRASALAVPPRPWGAGAGEGGLTPSPGLRDVARDGALGCTDVPAIAQRVPRVQYFPSRRGI